MFLNDNESGDGLTKAKKIKILLDNGFLEFVNGGISMPDSACTTFIELIDNYFYGMRYLKKTFG